MRDALKGVTKLHGFGGSRRLSVLIHSAEGVIANHPGLSFVLRNNSQGTQTQIFKLQHRIYCKHDPKLLVNHVGKHLAHKIGIVGGKLMCAALDCCEFLLDGPVGCRSLEGDAALPVLVQMSCCSMRQVSNHRLQVTWSLTGPDEVVKRRGLIESTRSVASQLTKVVRHMGRWGWCKGHVAVTTVTCYCLRSPVGGRRSRCK